MQVGGPARRAWAAGRVALRSSGEEALAEEAAAAAVLGAAAEFRGRRGGGDRDACGVSQSCRGAGSARGGAAGCVRAGQRLGGVGHVCWGPTWG